jgi:two-component system response regulator TctD
MRILLVEDHVPNCRIGWSKALRDANLTVECAATGADADALLHTQDYALVILDLTLPKMDGLDVLRRLRARGGARGTTPVLILTARGGLDDRVQGLNLRRRRLPGQAVRTGRAGSAREGAAAAQRRQRGAGAPVRRTQLRHGRAACSPIAAKPLALTPREHAVLEALITQQGRAVARKSCSTKCSRWTTTPTSTRSSCTSTACARSSTAPPGRRRRDHHAARHRLPAAAARRPEIDEPAFHRLRRSLAGAAPWAACAASCCAGCCAAGRAGGAQFGVGVPQRAGRRRHGLRPLAAGIDARAGRAGLGPRRQGGGRRALRGAGQLRDRYAGPHLLQGHRPARRDRVRLRRPAAGAEERAALRRTTRRWCASTTPTTTASRSASPRCCSRCTTIRCAASR